MQRWHVNDGFDFSGADFCGKGMQNLNPPRAVLPSTGRRSFILLDSSLAVASVGFPRTWCKYCLPSLWSVIVLHHSCIHDYRSGLLHWEGTLVQKLQKCTESLAPMATTENRKKIMGHVVNSDPKKAKKMCIMLIKQSVSTHTSHWIESRSQWWPNCIGTTTTSPEDSKGTSDCCL